MKFSTTIVSAAFIATSISAQQAIVNNGECTILYTQSFPKDGSSPGSVNVLGKGSWKEDFRPSGSTIKIANNKYMNDPLSFSYWFSSNPDYVYYELSIESESSFTSLHNILSAGDGCEVFDCTPGQEDCYSTSTHKKVYGCPALVNLTATVCA